MENKSIFNLNLNMRKQSGQSRMRDVPQEDWPELFKNVNYHEIPQKRMEQFRV